MLYMDITCISTSVNPPNILYYGTDSKYIHGVDGLYLVIGFMSLSKYTNRKWSSLMIFAIHPNNPDIIMVVF